MVGLDSQMRSCTRYNEQVSGRAVRRSALGQRARKLSKMLLLLVPLLASPAALAEHKDGKAAVPASVQLGILARLDAKSDKQKEVKSFVESALPLAQAEPATMQWFALQFSDRTYGIFDSFADDAGRSAHLGGKIAAALVAKAGELLASPPQLEKADILASNIRAQAAKSRPQVGIVALMEAKPGKEKEVEKFLADAVPLVKKESKTLHWYAVRLSPTKYGIFDTFADDTGRDAHLNGKVAAALLARASELFVQAPTIEKVALLAAKP